MRHTPLQVTANTPYQRKFRSFKRLIAKDCSIEAFPAWDDGEMGMMKGGGLGTVGYSPDGHAKQPRTFSDCRVGGCRRCCSVPNRVRVPPIVIDIHVLCMRVLADG